MKTAICTRDKNHKRFVTRVDVSADWVVDEHGAKISVLTELGVVIVPGPGNAWTCAICGTPAVLDGEED